MSRIAYVDGRYVKHAHASVHVEDRGLQFSDAVYEVCEVREGALIDAPRHIDRLERSLGELAIAMPVQRGALMVVLRETVRRNRVRDGMAYLQVTRGASARDHAFPKRAKPSLIVTARLIDPTAGEARAAAGVDIVTVPETRWARVDIKTTSLIANVLARQQARAVGAFEAWFVDPAGRVIEGAATNAWIVSREGVVQTHPADGRILAGVTRAGVIDMLRNLAIPFEEKAFSLNDAQAAAEAFCTGATLLVMPVVRIDGVAIGNGVPGPTALRLRQQFHRFAHRTPG